MDIWHWVQYMFWSKKWLTFWLLLYIKSTMVYTFINWFHNPFFNLLLLNCFVLKLNMLFSCAHNHVSQGLKINTHKFIIFQIYTNSIAFTFNFKNTNATPAITFSIFVTMVIMITITIICFVQLLIYFENKFLLLTRFYISTSFHSLKCFTGVTLYFSLQFFSFQFRYVSLYWALWSSPS